ncbi:hypothetical protein Tco_0323935 [Tanacetum coccineum]
MGDANPIRTLGRLLSIQATRAIGIPLSSPIAKIRNNILMFQQHQGKSLSEAWTCFKNLLQKFPQHGIDLWLQVQIFYDHVNPVTRRTIDQSAGGKLHDRNAEESGHYREEPRLYDNESWNDPRDFAKPVKAISLPQDVPTYSSEQDTSLNVEIFRVPHTPVLGMENPEQPFIRICILAYRRSRSQSNLEGLVSNFMASQDARLSKFEADFKQQQSKMTNKIDTVLKAITDQMAGALLSDTVKNPKLNIDPTSPILSARSYPTEDPQCLTHIHGSPNTITIHPKQTNKSHNDKPEEGKQTR